MRRTMMLVAIVAVGLLAASGVALAANKFGGPGPDTLRGTNGPDNLFGGGGDDELLALGGPDNLYGGPGKDLVYGGTRERPYGGPKNLEGGPGNDVVFAGKDSSSLWGDGGNDYVAGGSTRAKDLLLGGPGDDVIPAFNDPAAADVVRCGSGFDRVHADRKDKVARDCEEVFVGAGAYDRFVESIPESFFRGLNPRFG